jgi:hypothetical protein
LILHDARTHDLFDPWGNTMKFWILACGAIAAVAAHAAYTFSTRRTRQRVGFANDQVSSEWLASARIHEDENR